MYYVKQYKLIILSCLFIIIILISGYFTYNYFNKNKTDETQIPNTINTNPPIVDSIKSPISKIPETKPTPEKPMPIGTDQFVISLTATTEDIANNLMIEDYIKNTSDFILEVNTKILSPGAYKISKEMTPTQLVKTLSGKPYMKWIIIPPGLRKEEIATLLTNTLSWTTKQKNDWITKDTNTKPEYIEGVYAPETYLIPIAETPANVATRLISKFNENFAEYLPQFTAKNIKWTTALTFASLVQREAANVSDMPLIAGILWNRLNQDMMLNVDATLQYVRGDIGKGWWAPITLADKKIDSPYNTYKYTGLPPHPISNPSIGAIDAVLNPASTDCLYYLHDKNHITHCAVTYEEHKTNIDLYLKTPTN